MLKALIVIVGRTSCCQVPDPDAGSSLSAPANTRIRITPSQNEGIEMASNASVDASPSAKRPRRVAASTPSGRLIAVETSTLAHANRRVVGNRPSTSGSAAVLYLKLSPRSPLKALATNSTYWVRIG